MPLRFIPIPTAVARALQSGSPDANGQIPERHISDGDGNPCRHCLRPVPKGDEMLILSYRPFPAPQPYAETGPIFLCADACAAPSDSHRMPAIFDGVRDVLIKGYGPDDRIRYGTGRIVDTTEAEAAMDAIFEDPAVTYIHIRSARNNCFQCRVERG